IMAAALLTDDKCTIMETPALRDVDVMCRLLRSLGAEVNDKLDENIVEIEAKDVVESEAPFELVKKMRASILVIGPLLARTG
ncbi:UDP-N-acetylglucosamine 1-carboxyvinyltransferase, partial [Pseudomonas aeruginosa]|nr:UDP-N-acetylglucosamine 1-carboxyvinyltransferase [Pseudomonas aeruginosa]